MKKFLLQLAVTIAAIPVFAQEAGYFDNYSDKKVLLPDGVEHVQRHLRNGYEIVMQDGHYGLVNEEGKWIIPARFSEMMAIPVGETAHIITIEKGLSGVFDLSGKQIVPCVYDSIAVYTSSWMLTNDNHSLIENPDFPEPTYIAMGDGVQLYTVAGHPMISDPKKDKLKTISQINFVEGKGFVLLGCRANNTCAVIGPDFRFLSDFIYDPMDVPIYEAYNYPENRVLNNGNQLILVKKDGGYSIFDITAGEPFIGCTFDQIFFDNSKNNVLVANAKNDEMEYVVNHFGDVGVPFNRAFIETEIDSLDRIFYQFTGAPGYTIDTTYIFDGYADDYGEFRQMRKGKQSYVIPKYMFSDLQTYDDISLLSDESSYKVEKYGYVGLLDYNGNEIIPTVFTDIESDYEEMYLKVKNGRKSGLMTKSGEVLVPIEYDKINLGWRSKSGNYFYSEMSWVELMKDGVYSVYDPFRRCHFPITYKKVIDTEDEIATIRTASGKIAAIGGIYDSLRVALPGEYDDIEIYVADTNTYLVVEQNGKTGLYCYDLYSPENCKWVVPFGRNKFEKVITTSLVGTVSELVMRGEDRKIRKFPLYTKRADKKV